LDAPNLQKSGAVNFYSDRIEFINQTDPLILAQLNMSEDDISLGGGIKSAFSIEGTDFLYVAMTRNDCAQAIFFNAETFEPALTLPCIPESHRADLNSTGGAVLLRENGQVLFSTGTPTSSPKGDIIRDLAQDPKSPWGKILELKIQSDGKLTYSIFASGFRNPQGLVEKDGQVYGVDHGPRGGDEINHIEQGGNYGWPLHSYGTHYSLRKLSKDLNTDAGPVAGPIWAFVPSVATSFIGTCPSGYAQSNAPLNCLAVSSFVTGAIYFVFFTDLGKTEYIEELTLGSRIRKFQFTGDHFVAVTDFEGVIVGRITPLN